MLGILFVILKMVNRMTKKEYIESYFKKIFELLKLNDKSILVVTLSKNEELEKVIIEHARELNISELKFIYNNYVEKEKALLERNEEELTRLFNNNIYNVYALKGAVFLYLTDSFKYSDEVDTKYLLEIQRMGVNTSLLYAQLKLFGKVKWCGVFVPDDKWVKLMCEENNITEEILFEKLYLSSGLDGTFDFYKDRLIKNSNLLNNYNFESIRVVNSLGTDLSLEINNRKWLSIFDYEVDGEVIIPNFPSYEVYTTPYRNRVNGVVYLSKKIIYEDKELDGIILKFENGNVIECKARVGEEHLKTLINTDSGSNKLGEIAIVELDSPISKSGLFYHNTLFDENASCHIALGFGFLESAKNVNDKDDIIREEINMSSIHMDMMIGTPDMKIYGYKNNKEYLIYENGKFILV